MIVRWLFVGGGLSGLSQDATVGDTGKVMAGKNEYFKKMFGLNVSYRPDERIASALERAHDIRKFEIDLYWRRGLYFWGFNLAVFTSFGFLLGKMAERDDVWVCGGIASDVILSILLPALALALLGLFISVIWYFVHKGSKAWQQNWEHHIDLLEKNVTGNLHKIILGNRDDFYSVSRANGWVICGIGTFWLVAATYLIALMTHPNAIQCVIQKISDWPFLTGVPGILAVLAIIACHCGLSTGDRIFGRPFGRAEHVCLYRRDVPDIDSSGSIDR